MIKDVTIYGKPNCTYCTKAKLFLDMKDVTYEYIDVMEDEDVLDWFMEQGFRSFPQVFVGGKGIGGYDQLVEFLQEQ